ncbi:septum formation initiator family protein [Propionispora vibrioides]|jgi:cell division protein FtsL|uniref:Cell division protein FtsL n=1 Tax=Propionispora vibrioides TaxID=112903 RepID=A0A1H8P619_9FIRM|nr:cell division protein FtsL [Propionispora vibrioides]SEO37326.1 cell division protein FtsL [Propionispora vibrioides]
MLVNKKENWDSYYQEQANQTISTQVKENSRPNLALRAKCFATVLLLAAIAIVFTIQSEAMIRAGYTLVQSKAQLAKVEKENEQLHLDIAKLKSPQRIQTIATSELGMVLPKNIYYAVNETATVSPAAPPEEKSLTNQLIGFVKAARAEAHKAR